MANFYPGALPLPDNLYFKQRCQILVGPYGADYHENQGDFESIEAAYDIQETEVYGNDSTVQVLRLSEVYRVGINITGVMRQMTGVLKNVMLAAEDNVVDLAAITVPATKVITGAKAGRIYSTGRSNIVVTGVVDGDDETLVAGVDYRVDAKTGRVEALKDFAELTISYTSPAHKKNKRSIASKPNQFFSVIIRQLHDVGDDLVFTKCQLRADGTVSMGADGTATGTLSVAIKVMVDPLAEEGFELGYAVPLADQPAA
jgi:hypothetical protein